MLLFLLRPVASLHFWGHRHRFLRQDFTDSPRSGPSPLNPLATPSPSASQHLLSCAWIRAAKRCSRKSLRCPAILTRSFREVLQPFVGSHQVPLLHSTYHKSSLTFIFVAAASGRLHPACIKNSSRQSTFSLPSVSPGLGPSACHSQLAKYDSQKGPKNSLKCLTL